MSRPETDYVFAPQPVPSLAIKDSHQRFPVNRIFCVGRNYADHAIEMGHDPDREAPFFFLKPLSALDTSGNFPLPSNAGEVHHEVELVVALGKGGSNFDEDEALKTVFGYGVGLDMTLRDLQSAAKKQGRPWDTAKGFEHSAPCSALVPAALIPPPEQGSITLRVNDTVRQDGNLNQMIWKIPEIIAALSRFFQLQAGDIIMTGTPAGVGAVKAGDTLDARIEGIGLLHVKVTEQQA